MILMHRQYNEMCQFLVAGIYHFQFSLVHHFNKIKHWKLDINVYLVIGAGC